jgi:hypothetical protein
MVSGVANRIMVFKVPCLKLGNKILAEITPCFCQSLQTLNADHSPRPFLFEREFENIVIFSGKKKRRVRVGAKNLSMMTGFVVQGISFVPTGIGTMVARYFPTFLDPQQSRRSMQPHHFLEPPCSGTSAHMI